uniref:Uncharacterized protein n=1 Tax=Rhipicephalus zambeziensis TaxID=60191 RepID=A0A224YZA3_9ACAR
MYPPQCRVREFDSIPEEVELAPRFPIGWHRIGLCVTKAHMHTHTHVPETRLPFPHCFAYMIPSFLQPTRGGALESARSSRLWPSPLSSTYANSPTGDGCQERLDAGLS